MDGLGGVSTRSRCGMSIQPILLATYSCGDPQLTGRGVVVELGIDGAVSDPDLDASISVSKAYFS